MFEFSFTTTAKISFEHKEGDTASRLTRTEFALVPSGKLIAAAYLTPEGMPTKQGLKVMTQAFIQGLLGSAKYGEDEGFVNFRGQVKYIMEEILRLAEFYEKEANRTAPGILEEDKARPRTTDKDLVLELTERNKNGDYNRIIDKAKRGYYHDWKQPEDADRPPKLALLTDLAAFPELSDIRQRVIEGFYDEPSDEEDTKKLSEIWMAAFGNKDKEEQAEPLTGFEEKTTIGKVEGLENVSDLMRGFEGNDMQYSPKLKNIIKEVDAIFRKNDIMGYAVLQDKEFGEFLTHVATSWTCLHKEGNDIVVKARAKEDFGGDKKARNKALALSINGIDGLAQIMGPTALGFMDMADQLKKKTNFETGPIKITGHTTQNT